jgi:hypothetical protein
VELELLQVNVTGNMLDKVIWGIRNAAHRTWWGFGAVI